MKKATCIALTLLVLSACSTTRHYVNGQNVDGTRKIQADSHYFIGGVGQEDFIGAAHACGGAHRVVATETKRTFVNGVMNLVTLGIYTPQEYSIYCR